MTVEANQNQNNIIRGDHRKTWHEFTSILINVTHNFDRILEFKLGLIKSQLYMIMFIFINLIF